MAVPREKNKMAVPREINTVVWMMLCGVSTLGIKQLAYRTAEYLDKDPMCKTVDLFMIDGLRADKPRNV